MHATRQPSEQPVGTTTAQAQDTTTTTLTPTTGVSARGSYDYARCYCEENVHLLAGSLAEQRRIEQGGTGTGLKNLWAVFVSNPSKQVPLWCQAAGGPNNGGLVVWDYHVFVVEEGKEGGKEGGKEEGKEGVTGTLGNAVQRWATLGDAGQRTLGNAGSSCAGGGGGSSAGDGGGSGAGEGSSRSGGSGDSGSSGARVWDLDTTLPFPCPMRVYATDALKCGRGNGRPDKRCAPRYYLPMLRRYRLVPAQLYLSHFASDRSHMRSPGGGWQADPPAWSCLVAPSDGCTHNLDRYWDVESDFASGSSAPSSLRQIAAASGKRGVVVDEDTMLALFGVAASELKGSGEL
ncbi:hypothetical protein FOA52_014513 [Chlamydomonas sp. UWO 241]|nr:hypothetical protein FOA52_014513 [Chlamydomonas sp. UWO 241]